MTSTSQASESEYQTPEAQHPLLADRNHLEQITDVMYAKIQKVLFSEYPPPETGASSSFGNIERILDGDRSQCQ